MVLSAKTTLTKGTHMFISEINIPTHEKVIYFEDEHSNLRGFIAVHNTALGRAVGGVRLYPYTSDEEALEDVLRLSHGMSLKSSLADIDFGGGKSVIIAEPKDKTEDLLRAFGQVVDSLDGLYVCAEDMNTSVADMEIIHEVTPYVAGLADIDGDPSPFTALGVYEALKVTCKEIGINIKDHKFSLQGLGGVGYSLAEMIHKEGGKLVVCDPRSEVCEKAQKELNAEVVSLDEIYSVEADVFIPCARGAILNETTIPQLKCKAICGCANNQLAVPEDADSLTEKGILYAPDYLVNAGGIINVFFSLKDEGYNAKEATAKVKHISETLANVYKLSKDKNISPAEAANSLAIRRIEEKMMEETA